MGCRRASRWAGGSLRGRHGWRARWRSPSLTRIGRSAAGIVLDGAVGEAGVDVGEPTTVADGEAVDLGPSFACSLTQSLGQ